MPRPRKTPRLWLRPARRGRPAIWLILDGTGQHSTGCGASERTGAQTALEAYLARKYTPPPVTGRRLEDILIADVVNIYLREHAPHTLSGQFIRHTSTPILDWWGKRSLADVKGGNCRDYVTWRTAQKVGNADRRVSVQTARHELKTLRAAINYSNAEHGLPSLPKVTLPPAGVPRTRWLTRREAAAMIRAARRRQRSRHITRVVLIGAYTGTRSAALRGLKWIPSLTSGWIDVAAGVMHRRGSGSRDSRKRAPPVRIPPRLLAHMKRWHAADTAAGCVDVVHYYGRPIGKLRNSWDSVRDDAGLGPDVVPHTLRHTAATWLMQAGVSIYEAAGFLGMTVETLESVYGHHHPDFQTRAAAAVGRRA